MADLERGVPNSPDTVFEAGSVAKQFTAAAVLLLAREGKLSLDDPVRTYLPELPDYGRPLTIRHMLTHTSGLRDWGAVVALTGWPRGSRAYTQAHVLEIAARQRRLNFPPGSRWSYTNTGYNLAALIVERVSGTSFDAFTRTRIFEPLGMTRTSWRSDYTRLVPNRAIAYARQPDGFHIAMPFENALGNGGLLTTVSDLLKWNRNFSTPVVGDASFVAEAQQPGRLDDGRPHAYAMGLAVGTYLSVREIGHDGATGGYTADLIRFPDQGVSVAVLCNAATAIAPQYAHQAADLYLTGTVRSESIPKPTHVLTRAESASIVGLYRSALTSMPATVLTEGNELRAEVRGVGVPLIPLSASRFTTPFGLSWLFESAGHARMLESNGLPEDYQRVAPWKPTAAELRTLVGLYVSDEAEASFRVEGDVNGVLVMIRRPGARFILTPVYADAFSNQDLGLVVFRRDSASRVTALSICQERLWDMRFGRVKTAPDSRR
jgi:CubicO group peptidase (beta-lactamase class C family)